MFSFTLIEILEVWSVFANTVQWTFSFQEIWLKIKHFIPLWVVSNPWLHNFKKKYLTSEAINYFALLLSRIHSEWKSSVMKSERKLLWVLELIWCGLALLGLFGLVWACLDLFGPFKTFFTFWELFWACLKAFWSFLEL